MTERNSENSGTMSGRATQSGDGSSKAPQIDLRGLLKGDNLNGQRKTEVADTEEGVWTQDDDLHLPKLRGKNRDTDTGQDGDDRAGGGGDDALDRILDALAGKATTQDEATDGSGAEGSEERSAADGSRRGHQRADDKRERPNGVAADQRTVKMLAEDLDVDADVIYEAMIPLNDGTGRHVSLESLRAGYLGTDADTVHRERVEHEQRLAAFEVSKSEHETNVVRDRREVSAMLTLLQEKLPPDVVKVARREAQRQLQTAAEAMLERFPEWRDPAIAAAWQKKAFSCLKRHGFSKADAASITDARLCGLLEEHMALLDWAAKVRNPQALPKRPTKSNRHTQRGGRKLNQKSELINAAKQPGATAEQKTAAIVALLGGN